MKHVACGVISGCISVLPVGFLESRLGHGQGGAVASLISVLLLMPIGAIVGISVCGIQLALPEKWRPHFVWLRLRRQGDDLLFGRILCFGIIGLAFWATLYHMVYFFMTGFHHFGLASLALTVCLVCCLGGALLFVRVLDGGVQMIFRRWHLPRFIRPFFALLIVIAVWGMVVLPPLFTGPEASGVFGFIGLLAKDGLRAVPVISTIAVSILSGFIMVLFSSMDDRRRFPILLSILFITGIAPFAANALLSEFPSTVTDVDDTEGLAAVVAKTARKLGDSDNDGHARWMGGRDCDDTNPAVYPRAREIPDNGVDEDCSGEDLDSKSLMAANSYSALKKTASMMKKPVFPKDVSLFLITVDSLRWNAPGFMGYNRNITPNLDRLVSGGTIYERAYGLGSYTGQAVPPMMTGKYASELHRNDKHEVRVSGRETFAAELICGGQARCGAVLSHFLFKPRYGWNQGFDDWKVVDASPPGPGHIDGKYNSDRVANEAIEWLKDPKNTKGSFFFWTHFMDPHKEYLTHKGFKQFGDGRRDKYDHEVLFTDYHIGRMIDFFKTLPASKRTIFIVTSDHGEAFNEHGRWCHGKELWEEIIRVPLAIAGPGISAKRIARPTSHIDLFPTLLDVFGKPIPEGIHGRSLLPDWLRDQELPPVFIVADQPKNPLYETRRVFILDGWKLHDLPETGAYRFYKLEGPLESGDSVMASEPEAFKKTKAAYEQFLNTAFRPLQPVTYDFGPVEKMPLP